jgi:hypothetical protein
MDFCFFSYPNQNDNHLFYSDNITVARLSYQSLVVEGNLNKHTILHACEF